MSTKIEPKQARFVEEYLKDLNATQACIRAGYSKKNADKIGSQLLGKTRVAEAIKIKQEKLAAKAEITQEWVINNLKRVVEHCTQEGLLFEPAGANKALELLGKHLGLFTEKLRITGKDDGPIEHAITHKMAASEIESRIKEMTS